MVDLVPATPVAATFAVVPVLTGPLTALAAMLPWLLAGLLGLLLSLFRPSAVKNGLKLLWRLKLPLATVAVGGTGGVWGAWRLWPEPPRPPVPVAEAGRDWPLFRGGLQRLGAVAAAAEPTQAGLSWTFKSGRIGFLSSPAVVGNRVYTATALTAIFGGGSGEIYCFDADSGNVVWHAAPAAYRATFSSPVVSGDYLVCGEGLHYTRNARVICMDLRPGREGKILWAYRTGSHVECTPVIHEGHVYVGAGDDGYYCFRLQPDQNGQAHVVWHAEGSNYPDAETSLAVHGDRVYAGLGLGGKAICVLDARTGRELKRIPTGLPVFSPPAVADGRLYLGMGNGDYVHRAEEIDMEPLGAVWCIDLETLSVDWKLRVGRTVLGAVAAAGDQLFFASRDGFLYRVRRDGTRVKRFNAHASILTSPAVTDRYVYVVSESGMLYAVDRQTMELAWEFRLASKPLLISSPAVARGHVYVGTQFDGFLCVGRPGAEEEVPLWPGRLGGPGAGGNLDGTPVAEFGAFQWQYPADQMGETEAALVAAPIAALGDDLLVPLAGEPPRCGLACLPAGASADETPRPRWVYATSNGVYRSPAVLGNTVFVVDGRPGQKGRHLHAVALASGRMRWRSPVAVAASGMLLCTADDLLIQDEDAGLSCFHPCGHRRWSQPVGRLQHAASPCGSMVVAAVEQPPALVAMDRPTGRQLWRVELDAPPTTSPSVVQGTVYLGTAAGLEARALRDGKPRRPWRSEGGGVSSDFVLTPQAIAYLSPEGSLVVCSRDDGTLLRKLPGALPGVAPLAARGTLLYATAEGLMALAYGDMDAEPVPWVDTSWLGRPTTPMVLCRSNLYLGMAGWGLVRFGAER